MGPSTACKIVVGTCRPRRGGLLVTALFTKKGTKSQPEAPPKPKKAGFLSQVTEAIDFAQVRSEGDRELLDKAKTSLGRNSKKGKEREKMSREQYQALRRKVGGTARDYWKDYIQADEVKGYKSSEGTQVTGLPFLLAVVLGLVVATGVVVSQTAGNSANPNDIPVEQQQVPTRAKLSE